MNGTGYTELDKNANRETGKGVKRARYFRRF